MSELKRIEINYEELKKLMGYKPSLESVAAWFDVSADTIERRIKEYEGCTFKGFRDKYLGETKIKLAQKAISMALEGDRQMLKFSLKNVSDWEENPISEREHEPKEIRMAYSVGCPKCMPEK